MTKRTKNKAKSKGKKANKQQPNAMAQVGRFIGNKAGMFMGSPYAGGLLGELLGSGIGKIIGMGDYTIAGPDPSYNVLKGNIPKFSSNDATNIVCHREYLGDITGAAAFTNRVYDLNPGVSETFPWLSSVATSYQQYRFHGLIFEFRSLVTDFVTGGAPGVLVMTSNYNPDQPAYSTRQEAENAEFAVSVKPTVNLVHMVECDPAQTQFKWYNVRAETPTPGLDKRAYDYGTTQIITQANPTQVLGELWVSYCVEFLKPILPKSLGVFRTTSLRMYRSGIANATPLGTATIGTVVGNLTLVSISGTVMVVTGFTPGGNYSLEVWTNSANNATTNVGDVVCSSGIYPPVLGDAATPDFISSTETTGTVSTYSARYICFQADNETLTFTSGTGTYPAAPCYANILLTSVDY